MKTSQYDRDMIPLRVMSESKGSSRVKAGSVKVAFWLRIEEGSGAFLRLQQIASTKTD